MFLILAFSVNNVKDGAYGSALGPDWALGVDMRGSSDKSRDVLIESECEIKRVWLKQDFVNQYPVRVTDEEWPVYVELTNGKTYGCDFVVSATGVRPFVETFTKNNKVILYDFEKVNFYSGKYWF